jgi:hypothetical protein
MCFSGLVHVVEDIAIERRDKRFAKHLLTFANGTGEIITTHHDIASGLEHATGRYRHENSAVQTR